MKKNRHSKFSKTSEKVLEEPLISDSNSSFFHLPKKQACFIFILSLLLYANTLSFDFNLDDGVVITGNKFTQHGFAGIKNILTHDSFFGYFGGEQFIEEGRYRPLTQILFAIEYQFFGLNPLIGHLVNILFYGFLCIFLFFLLKKIMESKERNDSVFSIPFIAVILFVAHPIHTEVVANIKGLDEMASLLGSLATLYFSLKFIENKKNSNLTWIGVSFFLALLAKENSITFFAIIPLTIYFFRTAKLKEYMLIFIPMVIGFAAYLAMRYYALGFLLGGQAIPELLNNPFLDSSASEKYATIIYTWGKYLGLLIFPHPLTHDYYPKQIPIVNWSDVKVIVSLVISIAMLIYSILLIRKKNFISFSILFFAITFSISSNLIVPVGAFMNERFMFAPLLGFCLIIAYFLVNKVSKQITYIILGILLIGYSIKTFSRNYAWKDGYTLFTTDVNVSSNSAKCLTSAGGLMMEKSFKETNPTEKSKLLAQAIKYVEKAVEVHPKSTSAWLVLGRAELELRNFEYGALATENCLKISPKHADALNNMLYIAQQYTKDSIYTKAIQTYRTLIKYKPKYFNLYYEIASVYEMENKIDSSFIVLNELLKLSPNYEPAFSKMGELYGKRLNDIDKALECFLKAYSINTKNSTVLENIGVIYGIKKEYQLSIDFFNRAIEITPNNAQLYRNIAMSYNSLGLIDKYNESLKKAASL